MPYYSSLQSVVVYNFTEIKTTFQVLFWDYVADCLWFLGITSICLTRKAKYDWFLHEGLLLDWLIFLLYLLHFVCCSKYSTNVYCSITFLFLNLFAHFLHLFALKYLRFFLTVMQSNFTAFYLKFSASVIYKRILWILWCDFLLA